MNNVLGSPTLSESRSRGGEKRRHGDGRAGRQPRRMVSNLGVLGSAAWLIAFDRGRRLCCTAWLGAVI